ncbi:MAG: hypothetical protein LLG42_10625 [Chloroflexi bacterium]|nr:hypothetical protein [Chloroflexota bacterium]
MIESPDCCTGQESLLRPHVVVNCRNRIRGRIPSLCKEIENRFNCPDTHPEKRLRLIGR